MNDNRISARPGLAAGPALTPGRPALRARIVARLRSARFDAMLAVGAPTPPGSAIAARAAQLTSTAEREVVAATLRRCLREATGPHVVWSSRIPLHRNNIAAAEATINAITLRLHSPQPVAARGMARLSRVISDGVGPMYAYGRGDLTGRLGAALAAL